MKLFGQSVCGWRGERSSVEEDREWDLIIQTERRTSEADFILSKPTTSLPDSVQIVGEVLKQLTEEKCKFIGSYITFTCVTAQVVRAKVFSTEGI